ncbi:MAG: hypothetical protein LC660_13825, partial [Desulfobacteraceae bacterium]|nr:hypothetical protein [Desulfobacteraceae bacterium]
MSAERASRLCFSGNDRSVGNDHCNGRKTQFIKEEKMANCCNMKEGDVFYCKVCGLELSVKKACTCKE